ncbi:MAG: GGDEF domain-containing protein [Actinomycetota bacterium]|nr:GGDEF domain-containing protein [Actinomycetota bacterium]
MTTVTTLEQQAIDARQAGDFDQAGRLFAAAANCAGDLQTQLNLQIRQACCLLAVERYPEAAALAQVVAQQARAEGFLPELADALGVMVDHHSREDRLAEAAHILSEAAYILNRLPNEPSNYQVVHNMAVTYAHCGFVEAALELYDREMRLAETDLDRQFAYASMSSAYHFAAQHEPDQDARHRFLHDGLYAATAALDPEGGTEVLAMGTALAHRSMMLAEIGHYHAALDDAHAARQLAVEHGMREEQVIAMAGEAMAVWGSTQNTDVIDLIGNAMALATEINFTEYLGPLLRVEVEVLWKLGRFDEARAALERNLREADRRLHDERAARWEHVRLGVEHLRVEALSESDPLTGLPNRRHLSHLLPEMLEDHAPVCVGVIDLDGFKQVNDEYGYLQGDGVLQEVAGLLERVCRRGDSVVRLGGDEFVMVLRETSPGDARMVFERIRQMIGVRTWHGIPSDVRITASVGVAVGSGGFDASRVLGEATAALQGAKKSGRDRISFR